MASSTSILVHNNKILLILRDDKPEIPEPNTWQLPGGGVEEGEDYFQAISRELQEEISIIPKQLKYLGSAPGDTKVFFAFLNDEEVMNIKLGNEGQKLEFFNLEDVFKINLTKKLQFYLSKFKDGIVELIKNGEVDDIASLGLN
jgi:8-oxo-dGTP diphosphatase